jgi:catechol 2,3-dioxygenase-like lactoylglutathione lyase family enzyme
MSGINIEKVDHLGIRVHDLDRALAFYQVLGFKLAPRVTFDPVAIIRNKHVWRSTSSSTLMQAIRKRTS